MITLVVMCELGAIGSADYADYLIGLCGREQKADATWTFDRRAAESPLFKVLSV